MRNKKNMKKFFLVICLWIFFSGYSQRENDNWYFGNKAAVNFSGTAPLVLNDNMLDIPFESGSVSDYAGNLLFYTDGKTVMTREHSQMQNGFDLSQNGTNAQMVIVRSPQDENQYYIIVCSGGDNVSTNRISYSIVDMSQGNLGTNSLPLGIVLSNTKNIPIPDEFGNIFGSHGVTVVPDILGNYWVLIPNPKGDKLYSYLISSSGFNTVPVVSNIPMTLVTPNSYNKIFIKASPRLNFSNFSHYLSVMLYSGYYEDNESHVLSFNSDTGLITPDYDLTVTSLFPLTADFNKNGEILYLGRTTDAKVYAVNLLLSNTSVVSKLVYDNTDPTFMCKGIQRNSKNEIYVNFEGRNYLSKIIDPDSYSTVSLDPDNLYLNGNTTRNGLPQLIKYNVEDICSGYNLNKVLNTPEVNSNFTYQVLDYILVENNYETTSSNNITMKAGNNITFLPNTKLGYGSIVLAKIEPCVWQSTSKTMKKYSEKPLKLNLDENVPANNISISPNPTSEVLNIHSIEKMVSVSVFDMSGRKLNLPIVDNIVQVSSLTSGTYIITIKTRNQSFSKKFIKK